MTNNPKLYQNMQPAPPYLTTITFVSGMNYYACLSIVDGMNELYPCVSKFVILKSNNTFTGIRKPHFFALNEARFGFTQEKIAHDFFLGQSCSP